VTGVEIESGKSMDGQGSKSQKDRERKGKGYGKKSEMKFVLSLFVLRQFSSLARVSVYHIQMQSVLYASLVR